MQQLKELIYESYIEYMAHGVVNYKSFNSQISSFQEIAVPSEILIEPIIQNEVEISLNDDIYVEESSFLDDEKINLDSETVKSIDEVGPFVKTVKTEVTEWLNYYIVHSEKHQNIIDMIGFGRLLNIMSQILCDGSYSVKSSLLAKFLRANPDLIYIALKYRKFFFWFFCEDCNTINCHDRSFKQDIKTPGYHDNGIVIFYQSREIKKFPVHIPISLDEYSETIGGVLFDYVDCSRGVVLFEEKQQVNCSFIYKKIKLKRIAELLNDHVQSFFKLEFKHISVHCTNHSVDAIPYQSSLFYHKFFKYYQLNGISKEDFCSFYQVDPVHIDDQYIVENLLNKPSEAKSISSQMVMRSLGYSEYLTEADEDSSEKRYGFF